VTGIEIIFWSLVIVYVIWRLRHIIGSASQ
jgi:hypothetical protein